MVLSAEQAISIVVGALLSVVLQAIPPVERWWGKKQGKTLILIGVHLFGAFLLWALDCRAGVSTGVELVCNWEGLRELFVVAGYSFVSNQVTYGLTNYTPQGREAIRGLRVASARALGE